jgi:hypothetical protein
MPCPLLRPSYSSAATPLHGASASHGCSDALWGKLPALTTAGNLMVTPEPRLQRGGTASYCGALLRAVSGAGDGVDGQMRTAGAARSCEHLDGGGLA